MRDKAVRFHALESIGPRRHMTPEGFLVCEDVAIARTGVQVYGGHETPVPAGHDGLSMIERGEDQVFRPETIASFNGKPIVNDHPIFGESDSAWDVNPKNWRKFAVGTTINPHRGEGADSHLLIADLLITDEEAIKAILAGKREVSCGYSADYETISPGRGRQVNIVGNHVALVDHGRCGPGCAIGDSEMTTTDKRPTVGRMFDGLRAAIFSKDDKKAEEEIKKAEDALAKDANAEGEDPLHIHVHTGAEKGKDAATTGDAVRDQLDRIEGKLDTFFKAKKVAADAKPAPAPVADTTGKVTIKDSSELEAVFQDTIARAEMLSPGIVIPTFDAKVPAPNTFDALCQLRRRSIAAAWAMQDGRRIIESIGVGDLSKMTCDAVSILFNGASQLMRAENNAKTRSNGSLKDAGKGYNPPTIAEMNARNREMYGQPKR